MKTFNIILDLPFANQEFANGVIFTKFLPRKNEAIKLNVGKFSFEIYFSYDAKHLRHISNDFIKRQKDIKKHLNILTNSLRFEVSTEIEDELYVLLGNDTLNKETELFCRDLMANILHVKERIYDFARNVLHQVWLKPISYSFDNFNNFFTSTGSLWEFNGKYKRLHLKGIPHRISISVNTNDNTYISKNNWNRLSCYLEKDSKAKTEQIFIANSLEHLEQNNTRMAILESVIALEHYIKINNCENIQNYIPKMEFDYVKQLLLKKNQFTIPLGILLAKVSNKLKQQKISRDNILKAVEIRNMIMHNSQKEINYQTAQKCIYSINRFIEFLKIDKQNHITK
ncbi:MAG: hypothetical protein HGB12_12040 [Bacteroidetes bacterium]|nr:hypothetical protein [Bacteroidota bacterium]